MRSHRSSSVACLDYERKAKRERPAQIKKEVAQQHRTSSLWNSNWLRLTCSLKWILLWNDSEYEVRCSILCIHIHRRDFDLNWSQMSFTWCNIKSARTTFKILGRNGGLKHAWVYEKVPWEACEKEALPYSRECERTSSSLIPKSRELAWTHEGMGYYTELTPGTRIKKKLLELLMHSWLSVYFALSEVNLNEARGYDRHCDNHENVVFFFCFFFFRVEHEEKR